MIFSNNPEKLSLFGGGCNENDRILDLYGGLYSGLHLTLDSAIARPRFERD